MRMDLGRQPEPCTGSLPRPGSQYIAFGMKSLSIEKPTHSSIVPSSAHPADNARRQFGEHLEHPEPNYAALNTATIPNNSRSLARVPRFPARESVRAFPTTSRDVLQATRQGRSQFAALQDVA